MPAVFKGTQDISLDKVKLLKSIQPRDKLDGEVVKDYQQMYAEHPEEMPICRCFYDGHRHLLSRGFHRCQGG